MAKTYEIRERTNNAREEVDTLGRRLDELAPPEGGILPSSWDLIEISPVLDPATGAQVFAHGKGMGKPDGLHGLVTERRIGTYHGELGKRFAEGFLYNLGGMSAQEGAAFEAASMQGLLDAKSDLEKMVGKLNAKFGGGS